MNGETVVVVQCTNSKRDGTHPARDLYDTSPYFRKQRAYAETEDKWYIQSAKYGLVYPDKTIQSYDLHATDLNEPEVWGRNIAISLDAQVKTGATVKLLGGRAYTGPLVPYLERFGYDVHTPLAGMQIGNRLSQLDAMVK